jgi:hypothetical protein
MQLRVINFSKLFSYVFCGFLLLTIIGVARNYGIDNYGQLEFSDGFFNPMNQELGTAYKVYVQYLANVDKFPFEYGGSYFLDPIAKILYSLFPNFFSGDGLAIKFSMVIFGVDNSALLTEGLGFSPLLEAIINFGYIGLIIPFIFFPIICNYIISSSSKNFVTYFIFLPPLCGLMFNLNRIDFSTTIKMYFVICIGMFLFLKFSKVKTVAT